MDLFKNTGDPSKPFKSPRLSKYTDMLPKYLEYADAVTTSTCNKETKISISIKKNPQSMFKLCDVKNYSIFKTIAK